MSEWKEYKLGEVADILPGYAFKSKDFGKNGIPVIKIKDIVPPSINMADTERVDIRAYELSRISKYIVRKGDYVIAMTGATIGKIGKQKEKALAYLNQRVARIKAKDGICDDFIYYSISSEGFQHFVQNNLDSNSVQENISATSIGRFPLMLPPLDEQKRIAGVLSSLDDKMDLLHRENATLEALAETLFRHYFIENPDPTWKEGKLGDEFDFTMGQSPNGESFNEEGIGIPMYQGNADFGFRFPKRRVYTTQPTRFAEINDTLISVRAPVGAQNMATERCCIGRGVASFRYKNNSSYYSYTYYKLKSLLEEIKQFNDNGTVFGSISKSDFENLDIMIPDDRTIEMFQKQVKVNDDKIINNNNEIHTLIQTRDGLLPKLMSNEINI